MSPLETGPIAPGQLRRIDELFAARGASLVRAAHALTGSRPDAEDLLQEAFVRALARPEVFDGRSDGEAAAWLWIVMRRLWRDRQRSGLGRTTPMPDEVEQRLVDTAPPIPDQLLREWQLAVVYEGLARLGPRHRTAMILLGRGLGEVEAAELAGVTRRTMREWRRDARRALGVFGERLDQGTICESLEGRLSAYADGELAPGKLHTQVEAHLAHCAPCRAALERIRAHTRSLGAVLPVAGAAGIAEQHSVADPPFHIGHAIEVLGPPRVVVGGHDSLVAYAEAHWRLVATTAVIALTGWALVAHAFGNLSGRGTPSPVAAPPRAATAPVPAPGPHTSAAARPIHLTARHRTRATVRTVTPTAPPVPVLAASPGPTIVATTLRTAASAAATSCSSAACLFGP